MLPRLLELVSSPYNFLILSLFILDMILVILTRKANKELDKLVEYYLGLSFGLFIFSLIIVYLLSGVLIKFYLYMVILVFLLVQVYIIFIVMYKILKYNSKEQ